MIRLRSLKLMSGVSTLAVLATFGAVDPVLAAGTTVSGPGNVGAIDTSTLPDQDFVTINGDANVAAGGSGSFYNPSTETINNAAGTGLQIDDAVLQGTINNVGELLGSVDGLNADDAILNGIVNSGTIDGAAGNGIELDEVVLSGGISNTATGTISGTASGINLTDTGVFSGGITNAGLILSTAAEGIYIENDWSFSGGINNSGTIEAASSGIDIDADSFSGGITNSGLITTSASTGIYWTGDSFAGGINNTTTGTINADTGYGIYLGGGVFTGGITNAGLINAPANYGIYIDADQVQGGINNSGSIAASITALYFDGDLFQGGVTNSGVIESVNNIGLYLNSGDFQGGINNAATGTITALETGIYVGNDTFQGGITNSGLINSPTGYGIYIDNSLFEGGINNTATGTITTGAGTDNAIYFSGTTFNGGITNAGLIQTTNTYAVYLSGTSFNGGIVNSGVIQSDSSTAIYLSNTTFSGGINNSGTVVALTSGYGIYTNNTSFTGGINNSGTIQGGQSYTGLYIDDTTFAGGITNSGLIASGSTGNYGIYIATDTFSGGINNTASGTIQGSNTALYVSGTTFAGGITNAGLIQTGTNSGYGIYVGNTTFSGGINNSGTIASNYSGIYISNTTFTGGIVNSGLIASSSDYGIDISNTTFTGGINNSGTITGLDTAVYISTTTFEGGITNSGLIDGGSSGVAISATNFTGGFNNTATGVIQTDDSTGVYISSVTNWSGNFTNDGTILGATGAANSGYGAYVDVTTFSGDFVNNGLISGGVSGYTGVYLTGTLFDGDVTNSGTILAFNDYDGLSLNHTLYTGDVTNSGTIRADGTGTGIYVDGSTTIAGALTNSGLIDPSYGIYVDGAIQGGIFNSGTILATNVGIDLSNADGTDLLDPTIGHTITQTAGLIQGNSLADGTGTVETALNLDNGLVDTVNANGGAIDGDMDGDDTDIFNVAGIFNYLRGTSTDFAELNVNSGVGTFGTGGEFAGDFEADAFNINGGTAVVGDLSTITVNNDFTVFDGGTLGFFLTTDDGTHGLVDVGGDAFLAGPLGTDSTTLLAVLDPSTFASATTDTYVYDDIITGTINNTFTEVTTSSLFWLADATYNANDVDLEITRVDFGDVLNQLGLIQTQNQQAIGDVLEEIFQDIQVNGPVGNEFDNLFAALFGTTDPAEILAMYDEINGSEHAQVQQAVLGASQLFNTIAGDQMDRTLLTLDGARFANLGTQRYASAAAIMASDASAATAGGSHGLNRGNSGVSLWARGFGQWSNNDGDLEAEGYDHDSTGAAGGVEVAVNNNASIGGAVVYSNNDVDFDSPGDAAEFDSWQVGLYGNYGFGNFYAGGSASYAWHDVSTLRTIQLPVPNAPFTAVAGYDASAWTASGEVGGIWRLGRVNVQPSAGLAYSTADTDGFTETGDSGAYELIVGETDADSFAGILALRASGLWTMGQTRVVPDIKVGWRHEFNEDRQSFTAIFVGDPTETPFTIVSSEVQQDAALLSAGLTFGLTNNLEIFTDVNGLYSSDASSTNASGGVRLTW
jgi:outer membrane autotransporter protein